MIILEDMLTRWGNAKTIGALRKELKAAKRTIAYYEEGVREIEQVNVARRDPRQIKSAFAKVLAPVVMGAGYSIADQIDRGKDRKIEKLEEKLADTEAAAWAQEVKHQARIKALTP